MSKNIIDQLRGENVEIPNLNPYHVLSGVVSTGSINTYHVWVSLNPVPSTVVHQLKMAGHEIQERAWVTLIQVHVTKLLVLRDPGKWRLQVNWRGKNPHYMPLLWRLEHRNKKAG